LNADGDFNDANELVASKVSNSSSTLTSIFTIPATATLGLTRMRVQAKYNSYGSPCETFANGEVEDYSIEITSLNGLPSSENEFTEINMNDLKIYPNPVNEQLTF